MRQEFLLKLFKTDKSYFELTFNCSKRQVDKIFYSLAFAACCSDLERARLYLVIREPSGHSSCLCAVNSFIVHDPFYRLVYESEVSRPSGSPFDPSHLEQYKNVQ